MPQLGLSNSTSRIKQRKPRVFGQEDFEGGSHGFTGNNANIDIYEVSGSNSIRVDLTDANGYAYRAFTVTNATKVYWRVTLMSGELSSGTKTIKWGTSHGDGSLATVVQSVPGVTSSGTFATGGTTIYLSLQSTTSAKFATWDNVLLETLDSDG